MVFHYPEEQGIQHNKISSASISTMKFTPFHLEDLYNKFENQYQYNFSSACMPVLSLKDIFNKNQLNELTENFLNTKLDYSTKFGSSKLREALVKNLYPCLKKENFITTAGASEAIYLIMKSLFNKGDKVIVQKPIYQSLFQVAQDAGAQIIEWHVNLQTNSWDINELKDLISKNSDTKALVINNPNNPIGVAFNKNELKEIIGSLDERILIADEVFQPLSITGTPSVSALYKNAIGICDLSKSFSLPGLRLGWISCQNQELINVFSSMRNYLSLRTSLISDLVAPLVLDQSKMILNKNKMILKNNIDSLYKKDKEGLFFNLDIPKEKISSLCIFTELKEQYKKLQLEDLVKERSIFIALGDNFGEGYKGYCRIGLGNLVSPQLLESML
jgi:aspartate/methionine/tyrosine aminotransferase